MGGYPAFTKDSDKNKITDSPKRDLQQSDKEYSDRKVDDEDGSQPTQKSLRQTNLRWCMLFMCCMFLVGNYFCSDNPADLQSTLQDTLGISTTQYGLFVTVYSAPNFILPLIGGVLLDMIGVRVGLIVFTVFVTLGQGIFMWGGFVKSFPIMLVGRIVFGLGGEC